MKKLIKYALVAVFFATAALLVSGCIIFYKLSHDPNKPSIEMAFRDMKVLSKISFSDASTVCEVGSERRVITTLERVSKIARDAFLSVEDEKFYEHNGVNYWAILRAAYWNLTHTNKQGASTITQQVVKNLLLTSERSLKRKAMEAILAIELEEYLAQKLGSKKAAKDKIFEIYLNWINFGSGRYGIESASQNYFGKSALDLNLVEAAALASIPKSPEKYGPRSLRGGLENADRRGHVLRRMLAADKIGKEQYEQAIAPKKRFDAAGTKKLYAQGLLTLDDYRKAVAALLPLKPGQETIANFSQEICDAGKKALRAKHCPGMNEKSAKDRLSCELKISSLGTTVETTIDRKLQGFVHQTLASARYAIGKRHPGNGVPFAAAAVIRNKTGETLSLASSPYAAGGLNYAFARRQMGSTMKPIVYACGFHKRVLTPESVFIDEESYLDPHHPGKVWPSNYEPDFMGAVNIRTALAHSINTVAVKAAIAIGPGNIADCSHRLGISSEIALGPSIALGVSDISPLEMAGAYSTFARRGTYINPRMFMRVSGEAVKQESHEAISPRAAEETLDIMSAVINEGTGRKVKGRLPVPSYGKTGTTSGHTDAWFGLMTADYTVMVWVGHETMKKSLGARETGASAALPAALDIMHYLYTGKHAGAVYSMSTKPVKDVQLEEDAEFIEAEGEEEGSGMNANNENLPEFEVPDEETEKASKPRPLAAPSKPAKAAKRDSFDEFVPSDGMETFDEVGEESGEYEQ